MVKCITRTSILYKKMFVFRFFSEKLFRSTTPRLKISRLALFLADALTDPALVCDVFFIIEYVSIKHDCKNCISISINRSLHINLDDAPLAHKCLDAVLITSNM